MSSREWEEVPHFFEEPIAEKVFGASRRYITEHAEELGAVRIAGKFVWCKEKVLELFGVDHAGELPVDGAVSAG